MLFYFVIQVQRRALSKVFHPAIYTTHHNIAFTNTEIYVYIFFLRRPMNCEAKNLSFAT